MMFNVEMLYFHLKSKCSTCAAMANILRFLVTCVYGESAIYDMLSSIILSLRIKGLNSSTQWNILSYLF